MELPFESDSSFSAHLHSLRQQRRDRKLELGGRVSRKGLTLAERDQVFIKTGGRCHICGGRIEGAWEADHVFSHSLGGEHAVGNYLPAHPVCNNYRWFYGAEEFQWILKLGVWLRTQIERQTPLGRIAAKAFCSHERTRISRRKRNHEEQRL